MRIGIIRFRILVRDCSKVTVTLFYTLMLPLSMHFPNQHCLMRISIALHRYAYVCEYGLEYGHVDVVSAFILKHYPLAKCSISLVIMVTTALKFFQNASIPLLFLPFSDSPFCSVCRVYVYVTRRIVMCKYD